MRFFPLRNRDACACVQFFFVFVQSFFYLVEHSTMWEKKRQKKAPNRLRFGAIIICVGRRLLRNRLPSCASCMLAPSRRMVAC